jgi:hypothetical protein
MKIQMYKFAITGMEPIEDSEEECGYMKRSDILPLLNPWRDAENEKPESNENVLCNTKDLDGKPLYQVGYYIEGYGWYLEHDLTVIAWMHIPKNEGEE